MYKIITKCRVCSNEELISLFDLGNQYLTGVFPRSHNQYVGSGPVELVKCNARLGCGLVQLRQSYDLELMYGDNYGYRSGLNPSMVSHLQSKVKKILDMKVLQEGDYIIDIGSNDATTLLSYPNDRYSLVGIDPSAEKFRQFYTANIKLLTDFFSSDLFFNNFPNKSAKIITSFSMFYDLEDPVYFAKEVEKVLHTDGLWIFEQSYLPAMLNANSFDTICHEHLEFYCLKQILFIAKQANLRILDVEFNDINGGSFSIVACKVNSIYESNIDKIKDILKYEDSLDLDNYLAYDSFSKRVNFERNNFLEFLNNSKVNNKSICAVGASTKGNVLLQYYGLNINDISMIGEVNEDKFNAFTPGTLIPLVSEDVMLSSNPDYILVLPWHFKNFFVNSIKFKGRTLIFPLPNFEVVRL